MSLDAPKLCDSCTFVISQANKKISGNLKAQEAAGHTGSHLEKVWHDTLVETGEAFLGSDNFNGVKDPFVFVAHALHLIDLESSAENITVRVSIDLIKRLENAVQRVSASLSDGS